jgi:peptide-methionine (S)-S-oxide reductase
LRIPLLALVSLGLLAAAAAPAAPATAVFAGGCFWCEETAFEGVPGVLSVTSGYAGGQEKSPTYEQVSAGRTGHAESVRVAFDPARISYAKLLDIFWHNVDPFDGGGQFCDRGNQYRPAIFYADDAQRREAEASKARLESEPKFKGQIKVQIAPAGVFTPAEEYHQDYYKKNPAHYQQYRQGCGRDARLKQIWGAAGGGHS